MLKKFEDKMQKSYENMTSEFMAIRAGRANPHVLDKVTVDYYGVPTPIQQVGNVSVPEARTILIQPWEPNLLGEIEKAIMMSDIGITPNNDGSAIRLNFPELTEERRKDLAKDIKKRGETTKVAVLHYVDGAWKQETAKAGQGTITATFDSLSPVAFVVDKNTAASSSTSPKTGESMAVTMAAVVVVVAAAGAFAFRKKESVR